MKTVCVLKELILKKINKQQGMQKRKTCKELKGLPYM